MEETDLEKIENIGKHSEKELKRTLLAHYAIARRYD